MVKLQKNGGVKMVSNESLIELLLADGWTTEDEVKKDESKERATEQPARRGRPKKIEV